MIPDLPAVLYLHGLDSNPAPEKTGMVAEMGFRVFAPQMHYREENNLFDRLCRLTDFSQPDWIIGSSLGGYVGFWLSRKFKIPAILINPALSFYDDDPGLVVQHDFNDIVAYIVYGLNDNIVPPENTLTWLNRYQGSFRKIHLYPQPEMGHRIRAEQLKEIISMVVHH